MEQLSYNDLPLLSNHKRNDAKLGWGASKSLMFKNRVKDSRFGGKAEFSGVNFKTSFPDRNPLLPARQVVTLANVRFSICFFWQL